MLLNFLKKPSFSRYVIATIFLVAGILHFLKTQAYIDVMPEYIPYHKEMVLISGLAEFLGGVGILITKVRKWAGWGLMILLIAVFPVNIDMAVNTYHLQGWSIKFVAYLLRLPLQFVLIYCIYWSSVKPEM